MSFLQKVFCFGHGPWGPIFAQVWAKNGFKFQSKLLILIESPKIFHCKPAKKFKVGVVLGQNLGQIRYNVVKKIKKQALSIGLFHILHEEYLLKHKVLVVQTLKWKFKTFAHYFLSNFYFFHRMIAL